MEEKKRIYKDEFNEILRYAPDISEKERQYLNQVFANDLIDGLTEWEIKDKINKLAYNTTDELDPSELATVKSKLLSALGK